MKTTVNSENRFESDASRYAAYLETPEGRLRGDLTFANVQDFLLTPSGIKSLRALDLGCGTGDASIRLARLGVDVTSLDASPAMLDLAERAIAAAGLSDKVRVKHGDAARLADIFEAGSFDIVLCHNLLEYVDDPGAVLRSAARGLRDSSAMLSVLVRNQAGEVLKAALQMGDLITAERNLDADWGHESLYGGEVRLFTPEALDATLNDASLTFTAQRGVRVIADYLPAKISRSAEYERIFALERRLGKRREFFGIARYMHVLARHAAPLLEVDA
ncbi:MAG TPA: methyltransferase domain-containing protein [Candidatus Angelobacter sp.]|nr:methyltransferase domain-containing protein [Candidatus Angelobacter sp.]